ncbi:MAG: aspartate/glutamate racemase family protein [Nitrospinota bacterium]|nr:MAG: aspartate/glutamate racemase family protein [Nitrospinota bacterium]
MSRVTGGPNLYGYEIGILTLETRFPRIPGDIGNACSFPFPVRYYVVKGASPERVVKEGDPALLQPFIEGARFLEREGVKAITTSCGFLALFQREMAAAVSIPVFTSTLLLVPLVHRMLRPDQQVGILTVYAPSLSRRHLEAVGAADTPVVIVGAEQGKEFSRVLLENEPTLDVEQARQDLLQAAQHLVHTHPRVGAIVLECTNMPPYARQIQQAVGLPVFDILSLTTMVYQAVHQCSYEE